MFFKFFWRSSFGLILHVSFVHAEQKINELYFIVVLLFICLSFFLSLYDTNNVSAYFVSSFHSIAVLYVSSLVNGCKVVIKF